MGRDNYVPNPGANSSTQVEMFVFLGKLMGHAIRLASMCAYHMMQDRESRSYIANRWTIELLIYVAVHNTHFHHTRF